MSDQEIERRLRAAFEARAQSAVDDVRPVPPALGSSDSTSAVDAARGGAGGGGPRHQAARPPRRRLVWLAPVAAAAVVAAVVLVTTAVLHGGSGSSGSGSTVAQPAGPTAGSSSTVNSTANSTGNSTVPAGPAGSATSAPAAMTSVHVTSQLTDGEVVGVGMPIVLSFSPAPTSSGAFLEAATVTVNGEPADGAWYWEKPYADQPVQAHYRPPNGHYWPADSTIQVKLPIGGLSAGPGMVFADALTSVTFKTGDSHITTVDGATHQMKTYVNGKFLRQTPVSLGAAATPTFNGVKVVMQKGEDIPGTDKLRPDGTVMMSGPDYSNDPVQWSVRITASGEYLHSAPWNGEIGARSTSNGCTNLRPAAGEWFYNFAQIGDVVTYTNTGGTALNPLDGLGDWNVPWAVWKAGGLLPTQ